MSLLLDLRLLLRFILLLDSLRNLLRTLHSFIGNLLILLLRFNLISNIFVVESVRDDVEIII